MAPGDFDAESRCRFSSGALWKASPQGCRAKNHSGGYLRYVDDILVLGYSKQALWNLRDCVEERLAGLRLQLHFARDAHLTQGGRTGLPGVAVQALGTHGGA